MSDIINLPNNHENFYRKGVQSLEKGDFEKGYDFFQKSLALSFEQEVFLELVHACLIFNKLENLMAVWEQYYPQTDDIFKDESLVKLYVESMDLMIPVDKRLLKFTQLKQQLNQQNFDLNQINEKIERYQNLNLLKLTVEELVSEGTVDQWLTTTLAKGQYHILTQLKELYLLDFSLVQPLYQTILEHPSVFNYLKADIVHYCIFHHIDASFNWYWFSNSKNVSINELVAYHQQSFYQEGLKQIEHYCNKDNPHLEETIKEQFRLQYFGLFPFYDDLALTSHQWIDFLLYSMGLEESAPSNINQFTYQLLLRNQQEIMLLFYLD